MKVVVYSSDLNPDYLFYMPLTTALWRALGWGVAPVIVVPPEYSKDPKLDLIRQYSAKVIYLHLKPVPGYKTATVAQVSRVFLPMMLSKNAWVMTSDVDMWPLSAKFFEPENHAFHLFYGEFYEFTQFPMCYLAGYGLDWRRIMGYQAGVSLYDYVKEALDTELPKDAPGDKVWFFDEELFARRWGGVHNQVQHWFVIRNGYPPQDRIDRSKWPQGALDLDGKVDAHLPRPGWEEPLWGQLKQILGQVASDTLKWADQYRTDWLSCLEREGF